MKLQALVENLRAGIAELKRVIPTRNTGGYIPSAIKVETRDGRVVLAATDLTQYVEYTTGAKVEETGASLIDGAPLSKMIGTFGDAAVEIDGNGHGATISAGKRSVKLPGGDPDDFPPNLKADQPVCSTIADDLLDALTRVLPAASTDTVRPCLNAVNVVVKDGKMTLCTSDGFRLAVLSIPVRDASARDFLIPLHVAQTLARLLKRARDSDVEITGNSTNVRFEFGPWSLTAQMVDATFPNYESLIPTPEETATFARDDFAAELAAAAVLANEAGGIIRIVAAGDALTLASTDGEGADFTTEMPAHVTGPAKIALNVRYLADALKMVGSERVELGFTSTTSPVVLRDPDGPESGVKVVVMPMFVSWD